MQEKTEAVQGVGVYAEFRKGTGTTQIVFVPEGYTQEGVLVSAKVFRRVVTVDTPKKQWKFTAMPTSPVPTPFASPADADNYVRDRMTYAVQLLDQLLRGGWEIVKAPITLEISRKDYDDIVADKTPTKLIYRINQSREALDFPAELVQTV